MIVDSQNDKGILQKERSNLRAQMENEERKAMAEKFDEDFRLRFQEEVEKQK